MAKYLVSRVATALSTTTDLVTLVAAANRRCKVYGIYISGQGTASAANEVAIVKASTVGATPSGPIVATPTETFQPAATTVINTGWTTQPVITGNVPWIRAGVNANGGIFRWVALPGNELVIQNGENLSVRSISGTSTVTITIEFEE